MSIENETENTTATKTVKSVPKPAKPLSYEAEATARARKAAAICELSNEVSFRTKACHQMHQTERIETALEKIGAIVRGLRMAHYTAGGSAREITDVTAEITPVGDAVFLRLDGHSPVDIYLTPELASLLHAELGVALAQLQPEKSTDERFARR